MVASEQVHWKPAMEEGALLQQQDSEESSGQGCRISSNAHLILCSRQQRY
jgi:hypothetical protein